MHLSRHSSRTNRSDVDSWDELLVMGWRETVALPDLGIEQIHAKLDTGAQLSSIHATEIERFNRRRQPWIRFLSWSDTEGEAGAVRCEARWVCDRVVRSSNGSTETRPMIETTLYIAGFHWLVDATLSDRSPLECKLLLGREALSNRCMVDCGRSHLTTRR